MRNLTQVVKTACCTTLLLIAGLVLIHAQPVWQSSITASGDGTSASIGKSTGLATGDLMVVGLMLEKGSEVTVTPPMGWTLILNTNATSNFGMRN